MVSGGAQQQTVCIRAASVRRALENHHPSETERRRGWFVAGCRNRSRQAPSRVTYIFQAACTREAAGALLVHLVPMATQSGGTGEGGTTKRRHLPSPTASSTPFPLLSTLCPGSDKAELDLNHAHPQFAQRKLAKRETPPCCQKMGRGRACSRAVRAQGGKTVSIPPGFSREAFSDVQMLYPLPSTKPYKSLN